MPTIESEWNDYYVRVATLLNDADLNDWELSFLESLQEQMETRDLNFTISDAQAEKLQQIEEKYA